LVSRRSSARPLVPAWSPDQAGTVWQKALRALLIPLIILAAARLVPEAGAEEIPLLLDEERVPALIEQLSADEYGTREKASKELVQIGTPAIPLLVKALNATDPEVRMRSDAILRELAGNLVAKLSSDDPREAFEGLRQMGRRAFTRLAEFEQREDVKAQYLIGRLFAADQSSASTSYLGKMARSATSSVREFAVRELARRNAVDELLLCVEDAGDEATEELAAEAVIGIGEARIVPKLRAMLDAEEGLNRGLILRIVIALSEDVPVDRAVSYLRDKDETPSVKVEAAKALAAAGGTHAREALFRALRRMEPEVCPAVARALKRLGHPGLLPFLGEQLSSEEEPARLTALSAISAAGLTEAVGDVAKALADKERSVRLAALRTLGEIRSPRAISKVLPALADPDPDVRGEAVMAIRRIGGRGAVALLASVPGVHRLIRMPEAVPCCKRLVEAYRSKGTEDALADAAIEVLYEHKLLTHQSADTRHRAAIALYRLGEGVAGRVVIEALENPDPYVRLAAAELLGPMGDDRVVPPLIKALDDDALLVQRAAAHALGGLGAVKAGPKLLSILLDETAWPELRKVAATALATMQYEPAYPHFRKLADSAENEVRIGVASALATLGDRECVPIFIRVLREGTAHQQKLAMLCLRHFTKQSFGFDPYATRAEKEAAIRRWEKWWEDEKE